MKKVVLDIARVSDQNGDAVFRVLTLPDTTEKEVRSDPEVDSIFGAQQFYLKKSKLLTDTFVLTTVNATV